MILIPKSAVVDAAMAPASPFTAAVIVLGAVAVVAGSIIPPSETMRCHVCGNGSAVTATPGQAAPPALPARECRPDLPDERDCPPGYRGCLTAYDGRTLTRTCEKRALEDPCFAANGVVYCYCSHGSLCNSQSEDWMRQQLAAPEDVLDREVGGRRRGSCEDDEEDCQPSGQEGSGDSPFDDGDEASTRDDDVPVHTSPPATSSANPTSSTLSSPSSSTGRTTADDDDFYIKGGSRSSESTEAAGDGASTEATTAVPVADAGKGAAGHARGSWGSWTLAAACILPLLQLR